LSISSRTSELFTGENWQVIYQAFSQINFNASDAPSINQALQNYIITNYPESYNDFIADSEFIAIIDLLSWLAGNLAFKTDLSVRENFLEVAQAKESVLRLARFLSYNPSRNIPSQGVLKLVAISTNDDVYDSSGVDLANTTILWNNPDDNNWYERFTAILNNAFVNTNPFGIPIQNGSIGGITTQTYRFNSIASKNNYGFSASVSGTNMNFEICNGDFTNGQTLFERTPNPANAFQFYYLNDGNGNGSSQTGFFVLFKQGSTNSTLFNITNPVQNQLLNVTTSNINQNDVWVQTVDDSNNVLITWTPVPIMLNENITYNTLSTDQRNIYSVITQDNDQINIRFSDGNFGNAPVGNLLVTYRVSNGLVYTINPNDISNINLNLTYINSAGSSKTLTMTFSLQSSIANSSASESIASIQQNAPLVYATQNRMVSGQDYNTFPLQTNLAVKLKSLNRVYSGQSRYIDLNDPTGFYQDLSIFADDGIIFSQNANGYAEIPSSLNLSVTNLIDDYIQPLLSSQTTINAIQNSFIANVLNGNIVPPPGMIWNQSTASLYSTTGWFNLASYLITVGSMIKFSFNGVTKWVGVVSVQGAITNVPLANTAGPVTLTTNVPSTATVLAIMPAYVSTLSVANITAISNNISANISFSLIYDYINGWVVSTPIPTTSLTGNLILNNSNPTSQLYVMEVDYASVLWRINSIGLSYVFESITTVEWFNDGVSAIDQATGQSAIDDTISILSINPDVNNTMGYALKQDYIFDVGDIWTYQTGLPEPRRTYINLADTTDSGFIDNPESYIDLISNNIIDTYLFWETNSQNLLEPSYSVLVFEYGSLLSSAVSSTNTNYAPADGTEAFVVYGGSQSNPIPTQNNTFWTYSANTNAWSQDFSQTYAYQIGRGPNIASLWLYTTNDLPYINSGNDFMSDEPQGNQIKFQWKHYASYDDRIDPASQAIEDMFVLTTAYDSAIRLWISNGADPTSTKPVPPTELELRLAFASMENYKMFSDALVWHPVSYKLLFGSAADLDLQMQFKVIPSPGTTMSNGEIQSSVINAINTYFSIQYWDFGDTFYWSELSAYIHLQLAGVISSIVVVPLSANSAFGDGFEIPCNPNEIFISCAQVSNVIIIASNTPTALRIR
jgi:hypothetical protein